MTISAEDRLISALFDAPIYIKDGDAVHTVLVGGGSNLASTPDHDMVYEEAFEAMGGDPPPCLKFYKAVREHGFRNAFFVHDVFPGSVRIRILAEWIKLITPLYDEFIEEKFYIDGKRTSCRKLVDLIVKYFNMYMDPGFEMPLDAFKDETWLEKHDIGIITDSALFDMMNTVPSDKLNTGILDDRPYDMAYHVAEAIDYLQRACLWRLAGLSIEGFESCNEVHDEVDKGFGHTANAMRLHSNMTSAIHGSRSDQAVGVVFLYRNKAAGAASRITKKYVLEAK